MMAFNAKNAVLKITLFSVIGNIFLTAFKLLAGILGHSGAMISDAVHSLSDVLTTFIAVFGVKLAQRRSDREHPYGHERLECVASLILAVTLASVGIIIGQAGITNIVTGAYKNLATPTILALIAALVSIIAKEMMFWYTRYYAKRIKSDAFMADAWHHRSDALSSIGSLIGVGGAILGFTIMDSLASIVICCFILKAAFDIIKDAIKKMLDTACDAQFEQNVTNFVAAQADVLRVDLLQTRMFGNRVYIDLEISVNGDKSLREAHNVAEQVHTAIEQQFPTVKHVMIHVNPDHE